MTTDHRLLDPRPLGYTSAAAIEANKTNKATEVVRKRGCSALKRECSLVVDFYSTDAWLTLLRGKRQCDLRIRRDSVQLPDDPA